jgi:hypothetical protein
MKRIAAPMVGGMISSTVLTLLVIPAVYSLWKEHEVRVAHRQSRTPATRTPLLTGSPASLASPAVPLVRRVHDTPM